MRLATTDQAAVAVLLSGANAATKQVQLDRLLSASGVAHGLECPECSGRDVDNNGLRGVDLTYLCKCCDHQWSPCI